MLRRELAALAVGDQPALGDAQERVVRLVVLAGGEERLVGRDERMPREYASSISAGSVSRSAAMPWRCNSI